MGHDRSYRKAIVLYSRSEDSVLLSKALNSSFGVRTLGSFDPSQ